MSNSSALFHSAFSRAHGVLLVTSVVTATLGLFPSAHAATVEVPNASFESPTVSPPPAIPVLDNWEKTPEAPGYNPDNFGGLPWTALSGVFVGGPPNTDGSQAAYLFTLPGVGITQDLTATYQPGFSYQLTLGVHGGGGGILDGDQLSIVFYHGGAGSLTPITSTTVDYSPANFPDSTLFYDFSLDLPAVQSGDAWAGQNIGIEFITTQGFGSGSWDLDNVRLTMTPVPEPTTIAMLTTGLVGALLLRAHRRTSRRHRE